LYTLNNNYNILYTLNNNYNILQIWIFTRLVQFQIDLAVDKIVLETELVLLFKDHPELISEFNTFMSYSIRICLSSTHGVRHLLAS